MNVLSHRRSQRSLVALVWLVLGAALLALTPIQAHTATLGWAPLLWLVGAPAALLLLLQPRLPVRLLALAWPMRRTPSRRWR